GRRLLAAGMGLAGLHDPAGADRGRVPTADPCGGDRTAHLIPGDPRLFERSRRGSRGRSLDRRGPGSESLTMMNLLLDPYRVLFLLLGAGLVILWRRRQVPIGRLLLATLAFAGLAVLSTPALAYLCLGTLEWRYPPRESRPDDAEAIVVLGGGMHPPDA